MNKNLRKQESADFLRLLMDNQHQIYTYILKRVPSSSDADDIMQEVAIVLWEKFDQFQLGTNFMGWASTIAHNKILSLIRKNRNSRVYFSTETIEILGSYASGDRQDKEAMGDVLKKCMSKLPEKDRSLLQMRYNTGTTIKALAGRIGRPVHGLYSSLARIHNMLVKCVHRIQIMEETQ
ncbi:MAG: sigma-70 family RNA polymerase sigma factor [Anaerohalosphaera sp.]|nr:sigma-70 family RNA polymerase sigma factor [Anaerohalosphaera sp.]